MTFGSELLQFLTILMFPVIAMIIFFLQWKEKIRSFTAGLAVGMLILLGYFVLLPNYTIFSIGVIRCPDGQRIVEVLPSIFDRYGDQESCVADTLMSRIGERLAHLRPTLQTISLYGTLLICIVVAGALIFERRRITNPAI